MAGNMQEALRRIQENKRTKSKILDLSGLGLPELPEELWDCVWVKELGLGHYWSWNVEKEYWIWEYDDTKIANQLSSLPNTILKVKHLNKLFLDNNPISDISVLSRLVNLTTLSLSYTSISDISVLSSLVNLRDLDFFYMSISDISVLSRLVNLRYLNLGSTSISDISVLSRLVNLTTLYLGSDSISDISALSRLVNLTTLYLRSKSISDISVLSRLVNLTTLSLSSTSISDISVLSRLINLTTLDLRSTPISDISVLSRLVNLTNLYLSYTSISDINVLSKLVNLTTLEMHSPPISDISVLSSLVNLTTLDLRFTSISDISMLRSLVNLRNLFLSSYISDISVLSSLVNLTNLDLGGTSISDISVLSRLVNLTNLSFRDTSISDISVLSRLVNLTNLSFRDTSISDISILSRLFNLTNLDLSESSITFFPFELLFLPKIKDLNLQNTHCLNLPPELTHERNALPALRNYHTELQKDSYTSYDAKQILIGNGRVGKTSLLKTLYNLGDFDQNEDSTHGIQLFDSTLPLPEKQATAHLSLWDFGGQELYHATHRIFMKTRALYLVVWDPETEAKPGEETIQLHGQDYTFRNYPLSYWLGNVRALSKDAKIILICNKCDDGKERFPPNLQELQAEYNIDSFISISAKTGYGISTLRQRIQYLLNQMPEMGLQMPVSWRRVKEKLTTIRTQKPYIHIDEYHTVAATEDLSPGSMDTLLNFLHHSGFLFWNVHHIKDHPILDQKWALEAIYQLLDRNGWYPLLKGNALRRREELAKCWKAYSKEQIDLFLHMMSSCEIALELEDQEQENPTYLIPELLPDTPAPAVKDIWEAATGPTYHLRFQHPFFHAALIQRFIVRTAKLAERYDLLWRTGLLFKVDATMALVQVFPAQSRIEIQIRGKNPADLLQRIKKEIASIQNVQSEAPFQVSLNGLDDQWVSLDQLALQSEKGKLYVASTTGEILELAPFRPLLSSRYPDQDDDQEAPGLKELSDRELGLQLLIPTPPPTPLEGLKLLVKKELINEGIGSAITCLETHLHTDSTPATDLIVISSQFQAFNRSVAKGLHSVDEQYLLANRITNQVVALLTTIQEADLK